MREVLVEDFTGVATSALAFPDGVVELVPSQDADRREEAEGAAYKGDGGAWHIGGVRYIRGGRWQGVRQMKLSGWKGFRLSPLGQAPARLDIPQLQVLIEDLLLPPAVATAKPTTIAMFVS